MICIVIYAPTETSLPYLPYPVYCDVVGHYNSPNSPVFWVTIYAESIEDFWDKFELNRKVAVDEILRRAEAWSTEKGQVI